MKIITALLLACLLPGTLTADDSWVPVKHLIDTHIHLYDPERKDGIPWPPPDDKVLYKPHLPAEYSGIAKAAGVTGVVIVEASDRLPDNNWVLDLVADDPFYTGFVGNVDLYRKDFADEIDKLRKDKRFVGIRARRKGGLDFSNKQVLKNLRLLAKRGLSVDILGNGAGTKVIIPVDTLAREIPKLRIVFDHVLGYDIDGKPARDEWVAAVKSLATNKNVYCKVSGLYQRSLTQPAPRNIAPYRSLLEVLWNEFGADRLVYGSNWPCTKNSGDYASYLKLVDTFFTEKGQDARERYYWRNAAEAYGLPLK